jgi:tetratricopeptide (TPR) repeat protein
MKNKKEDLKLKQVWDLLCQGTTKSNAGPKFTKMVNLLQVYGAHHAVADVILPKGSFCDQLHAVIKESPPILRELEQREKKFTHPHQQIFGWMILATVHRKLGNKAEELKIYFKLLDAMAKTENEKTKFDLLEGFLFLYSYIREKSSRIFSKMLAICLDFSDEWLKIQRLYDIIWHYSDLNGSDQAVLLKMEKAADKIFKEERRICPLSTLGALFALAGDKQKASHLFKEALKAQELSADAKDKSLRLGTVAEAYAHAGWFREAFRIVDRIQSEIDKSYALGHIAIWYDKKGKFGRALQVMSKITITEKRDWFLQEIGEAYAEAGQLKKCHKILDRMVDESERGEVLSEMVDAYLKIGNLPEARKAAEQIKDLGPGGYHWRTNALAIVAKAEKAMAKDA